MANIKEGDLIRDCSSFNIRIGKIEALYKKVGRGYVLADLDITTDTGSGCSFVHCGLEPAWSKENTIKYWEENYLYWKLTGDPWNFAKRWEFTTVDNEGKQIFDGAAYKLKYESNLTEDGYTVIDPSKPFTIRE